MTSNAGLQTAFPAVGDDQVQILLVEDDDGDEHDDLAILVLSFSPRANRG